MIADLRGILKNIDGCYRSMEHRGRRMTKYQARKVVLYGIVKGYETIAQLSDSEVDNALGIRICHKTNKVCKSKCKGLCREDV